LYVVGFIFYEFQLELQLMERDRALLELERRWRGGEQWPQTSKIIHGFFLNYTHSPDCIIEYPKRGRKRRRRSRRKRAGGTPNSVVPTDAGFSVPSSHASAGGSAAPTPQLSPPTGAPDLSTASENTAENLIDLDSPPLMPGENISEMMATMNITEQQ
jgi:hypothetical protein